MSTIIIESGLHENVPFDEYKQWPAVSKHDLDLVAKSPAHYRAAKQFPPETTPAMHFGTAAHTWILEPDKAPNEVAVRPKLDRRTKAGKEAWAEWEMMHGHKAMVSDADARHLAAMAAAVHEHEIGGVLVSGSEHVEASLFGPNPVYEINCRCRPDLINTDRDLVIDLKTTVDASPWAFGKSMHKYRYHVQAAFYLDMARNLGVVSENASFVFLVVEKQPPYGVALYAVREEDIERGRLQYERDLSRYKYALETGNWFGYSKAVGFIDLPIFARREIDALTGNH